MDSLKNKNVWKLVQLPQGKKTIRTKYVFDLKNNSHDITVRRKSHLIASGFIQQ